MLTRGQLKMNMEVLGSEAPLAHLSRMINRVAIAMVIAGLFVGSSLMGGNRDGAALPRRADAVVLRILRFARFVDLAHLQHLAQEIAPAVWISRADARGWRNEAA